MSVLAAASASTLGCVAGIIADLIDFDLFKSNNNKKFANYYYSHYHGYLLYFYGLAYTFRILRKAALGDMYAAL
jgi:hypothetical protein